MKKQTHEHQVFLHLTLLVGLAVAQPLYDLVGANPEYLVAHRLEGMGVVAFTITLSLILPLMLYSLYRLTSIRFAGVAKSLLGTFLTVLIMLTVLPALTRNLGLDGIASLLSAMLLGMLAVFFYFRLAAIRLFLTIFSIAALVFPLKFLFFSPASDLLGSELSEIGGDRVRLEHTPPIFFLIFDEFPLLSILDRELEINAARYPNMAALVEDASWYRNHSTNSDSTFVSMPALLSGNLPFGRNRGLPSLSNYPDNLFALLGNHYTIHATEHGTRLCPVQYCGDQPAYLRLLVSDTLVLLGQIYAPPFLSERLPAINSDWLDFFGAATAQKAPTQDIAFFKQTLNWHKRISEFEGFLESIDDQPQQLTYFHAMLPHSAWQYMPDGRLLTASVGGHVLGIRPADASLPFKHMWYKSPDAARVSHQRHLLQVGYVDHLIGRVIEKLKSLGIYEESLLIITSDHGVSFKAGGPRRNIFDDNLPAISAIPLFIKYPGNHPSGLSQQNSQSMDIVPTIMDVLGATGWSQFDGQSLLDPDRQSNRDKIIYTAKARSNSIGFDQYKTELQEAAVRFSAEYGSGGFASLYRAGDRYGLIGRTVAEFATLPGNGPLVDFEHPELLKNTRPDGQFMQLVVHGKISGKYNENPANAVAISVNGVIRSVTGVFNFPNHENSFETLISPDSFHQSENKIEAWFIVEEKDDYALLAARMPQIEAYQLVDKRGNWIIFIDETEIPIERGEVPGWCVAVATDTPGTFRIGGWAADLSAEEPADKILIFVNSKFHTAISPNRETKRTADAFNMPGILKSAFRYPFSLAAGMKLTELEVRIFALSRAGKISELNYPQNPDQWVFRQNSRPAGPAIKPYR